MVGVKRIFNSLANQTLANIRQSLLRGLPFPRQDDLSRGHSSQSDADQRATKSAFAELAVCHVSASRASSSGACVLPVTPTDALYLAATGILVLG